MLTEVDYAGVSGINGVAWDAVELPSQFMENWCWEREALDLIAGHYQTGEKLPDDLYATHDRGEEFPVGACRWCGSWSSRCSICACTGTTTRTAARACRQCWNEVRARGGGDAPAGV